MIDTATMLRRNLRRAVRYPVGPASTIAVPLVFLLLFVLVFGDTMGAGLAGMAGGRDDYIDYVVPGILLLAAAGAAQATAIGVAMDMQEGIVARFRTMAIARMSVLGGHVAGNLIQTRVGIAVVVAVALLLGFGPTAGPLEWLAAAGLLALIALALIWLAVALGLVTKNVESASNLPMPLMLLPFLGSGFVPTDTMPTGMAWFAEHQPFSPMMESLRGLLMGTPIGDSGIVALIWCGVITLSGYLWARHLYERDPTP
jgi:ABC-2 type transport system permease protein